MIHKKITIGNRTEEQRSVLIALLDEVGFTGFEEAGDALLAFVPEADFDESALAGLADRLEFSYEISDVGEENWNAKWESEFEPVVVGDFCTIRAHFHEVATDTQHEIVITPKMSFGTGHHATTQLMIMAMQDMTFSGKRVLDFGTGTGVLAILAEKLGSGDILAIDNDEWAVNNSLENVERNICRHIEVRNASVESIDGGCFDIILANINRHILLGSMSSLFSRTCSGGQLIMSGLLEADEDVVTRSAIGAGYSVNKVRTRNGWISIACDKC